MCAAAVFERAKHKRPLVPIKRRWDGDGDGDGDGNRNGG